MSDTGFVQGFIQGLLTVALNEPTTYTVPKRYIQALRGLAKDNNVTITTADKGGGVVILDKINYKRKMSELLCDNNTYEEVSQRTIDRETKRFMQEARLVLRKSEAGRKLQHLIPSNPRPATMYGLPKTHKVNVPMRPITSGIGSAPHKLAGVLAKHLSKLLGTISKCHLKNSGDLIKRIKNSTARNKQLASLDVTSLFTKVPTDKAISLLREKVTPDNVDLPIPHRDFVDLLELCVKFNYFTFSDQPYRQKFGMAMGSPISAVLANLFMESLEAGPFADIIPSTVTWLRYVDDILIIAPRRFNLNTFQEKLNSVEDSIQFTLENEENDSLPYLDTLIIKDGSCFKFKVYRKPTNKGDLLHFFSHHDHRTKRGVLIGFFLRALRICSPEFVEEECHHITTMFQRLRFPQHIINSCREKATKIMESTREQRQPQRRVILQTGNTATLLSRALQASQYQVVCTTSQTIKNITKEKISNGIDTSAGVYTIPCGRCDKRYVGETSRDLNTRLREHRYACRIHDTNNACVNHRESHGHSMDWTKAEIIAKESDKIRRKCLEAAVIQSTNTIDQNSGMFSIAPPLANLILKSRKLTRSMTLTRPP